MDNFLMLLQAVPIISTLLQTVNNEVMEAAELNYFEEYSDYTHTHTHTNIIIIINNNIARIFDTSYNIFKLKCKPNCTRLKFSRR
jgi:hypothetical protein